MSNKQSSELSRECLEQNRLIELLQGLNEVSFIFLMGEIGSFCFHHIKPS